MRNLTITRTKSFVGCLGTMKVYIEDVMGGELNINGFPCRKLGKLKNGATVTFEIPDTATRIYVIADRLSISFCNEFYPIPAGTYNGVEEDVQTVAVKATIICKADLPEEDVYNFTKALFEKEAELEGAHAKFKELSLEYATDVGSVPFHAGAQKYYSEVQ